MAFTTWAALRTAIKDAIANSVAGTPMNGEYQIGEYRLRYRSYEELIALYEKTFTLESLESAGSTESRVSYGRYRRFR
jgi:hypothetical protein